MFMRAVTSDFDNKVHNRAEIIKRLSIKLSFPSYKSRKRRCKFGFREGLYFHVPKFESDE